MRRGQGNHYILEGSEFLGKDKIYGDLYTHGGFPGLVPCADGEQRFVTVEVYSVTPATLARLDRLEGVPHHYNREPALLEEKQQVVETYYYQINPFDRGFAHIESGDWVEWTGHH